MGKNGLVAALGMVAAAQAAPLAALPLLMEALDLGADRLGIAVAAGLLTTLALAPRAGALADRVRPSRTARWGLGVILAASALLCAYTMLVLDGALSADSAFAVALATRIANGAGVAVLHPSAQAWLWTGARDEEGAALQGRASAAQNAGRFAGPLCVAFVGGAGAAWTLAALAAIAASALLVLALTPGPGPSSGHAAQPADDPAAPGRPPGDTKALLAALLALHLLGGGAQFLLGPLLVARLDLGAAEAARWAGWLMALAAASAIVGNLAGRRAPSRRRAAVGAALATAGALALAPFAGLASAAAGVAAVAAGIGAAVPSMMAELMRRTPTGARGRAAGRAAATQAAAYAAAAPACGALFAAEPALAAAALPLPAAAAWLILMVAGRAGADARTADAEGRPGAGRPACPHRRGPPCPSPAGNGRSSGPRGGPLR